MKIEIFGIDDVIEDLKKMDRASRKASAKSVRSVTNKMRNAIKQAAPQDSGVLKKSIKSRVRTYDKGAVASGSVVIEAEARYWIPLEFGHSNGIDGKPVPPKPFVYNTRDKLLPGLLDELENDVDSAISQTGSA